MKKRHIAKWLALSIAVISVSLPAAAEKLNSSAFDRMQDFHLKQAEAKIAKEQLAHAWGDLAYLVCYIPNHHAALKYMLLLAPRLDKTQELKQYFDNAIAQFPEDKELQALHAQFMVILEQTSS